MLRYAQGVLVLVMVLGVVSYGSYKYGKGVSDTEVRLENAYLSQLAKVEAENSKLLITSKEKEEEYFNELFNMQENADRYIANVRTNTKRLFIKTGKKCLPKDESSTEVLDGEGRGEVPSDIAEGLARRRKEADKLVLKYNACVDYVKRNFEHINGVQK